jgi:hypothetical protein
MCTLGARGVGRRPFLFFNMGLAKKIRHLNIPEVEKALRREEEMRVVSMLELNGVNLCGVEVRLVTPRMELELQAFGNAFACGRAPMREDVFNVLWRMSPHFRRNVSLLCSPLAWLRREAIGLRVWWAVRVKGELHKMQAEISEHLKWQHQDTIGEVVDDEEGGSRQDASDPGAHWAASASYFWQQALGLSFDEYMDTPVARLNQWFRTHMVWTGKRANFLNDSDIIAGRLVRKATKKQKAEND